MRLSPEHCIALTTISSYHNQFHLPSFHSLYKKECLCVCSPFSIASLLHWYINMCLQYSFSFSTALIIKLSKYCQMGERIDEKRRVVIFMRRKHASHEWELTQFAFLHIFAVSCHSLSSRIYLPGCLLPIHPRATNVYKTFFFILFFTNSTHLQSIQLFVKHKSARKLL